MNSCIKIVLVIALSVATSYTKAQQVPYCGITDEAFRQLHPRLVQNIQQLKKEGKLDNHSSGLRTIVQFEWPLQPSSNFNQYSYYETGNYADTHHHHDGNANTNDHDSLDYNCGIKLYNDHNGVDIGLKPFPWKMMTDGMVNVVAAAGGYVIDASDGHFDRNFCAPHIVDPDPWGNAYGNYVVILHEDNSIAIYGHLKMNSITVDTGDYVQVGQKLATVGSSGASGGPHLHLEFRDSVVVDSITAFFEPFTGPCNPGASRWVNQKPYYESGIVSLMTHSEEPEFHNSNSDCNYIEGGGDEETHERNHFSSGDVMWLGVYFRDCQQGQTYEVSLHDPFGSGFAIGSGAFASTEREVKKFYSFIPVFYIEGTWKLQADYDGKTYVHYFTVGCPPSINVSSSSTGDLGVISGSFISSTSSISGAASNRVYYEAESYVQLAVGFEANSGCEFKARIDDCTAGGVKTQDISDDSEELIIYPNPANTSATVAFHLTEKEDYRFYLLDVLGKEILYSVSSDSPSAGMQQFDISLDDLPAGIYIAVLETGGLRQTKKLVVQK